MPRHREYVAPPQRWRFESSHRCRRCHRPLRDPQSIATGYGPECRPRGTYRYRGHEEPIDLDWARQRQKRNVAVQIESHQKELRQRLGLRLLRTAIVGASCGMAPGACPAILAFSKAADVFSAGRRIIARVGQENDLASAAETVGKAAATEIIRTLLTSQVTAVTAPVVDSLSREIGGAVPSSTYFHRRTIVEIARETLHQASNEGMSGLSSWAIGD